MLKEGQIRIPSACGLLGYINKRGKKSTGDSIVNAMSIMRERGNGLGAGFAVYGIYPDRKDYYAFHLFFENKGAKDETETFLQNHFTIIDSEEIPTRKVKNIKKNPIIWRYFLEIKDKENIYDQYETEEDLIVDILMSINSQIEGAYVFSSGKNMGIFKGVGYPEDIGEFYKLESYKGYIWTAHSRFPTNTPGWWGGAHPFGLLNWSVVHNGEISSYGANMRFIEMFGYKCTLRTDTEVITYLFDLLVRKHKLPLDYALSAFSPPFHYIIEGMPEDKREIYKALRIVYQSSLLNGPFAIIIASDDLFIALNDRIKLRPLVVAQWNDYVFVASEESTIRVLCPNPEKVWMPKGGEPVIEALEKVEVLQV